MSRATFKKIITSPELLEEINPKNKRFIERFLKAKSARCSKGTVDGYRSDLNIFFCYNVKYNENKPFIKLKKIELVEFFDYGLEEMKWSGNRYTRMRSTLSSLSDFIESYLDEDYPEFRNIIEKSVPKVPKVPVRKKTILTKEEVDTLRDSLVKQGKIQQACCLMLMATSGARISEVLRIDVNLIDENHTAYNDLFLETTEEIKTKGHGKNGTMMTRYIIKDAFLPILKQWLPLRKQIMDNKNIEEHNKLFITKYGVPMGEGNVRAWIKEWEKILDKDLYAHCFRHYIVTDLTRKGCSSDFIIGVMKWKSADMYNIYNDLEAKDRQWKEVGILKNAFK